MEFNFFEKSRKSTRRNPFFNVPKKDMTSSRISEESRKEEEIVRHSIPKELPNMLRVNFAKYNPDDPMDLREVITHIKFPEDQRLCRVSEEKIQKGLRTGQIVTQDHLEDALSHAFCKSTIRLYMYSKDIYAARTIFWFPKPILLGYNRYYIAQDVAHYVQFVEDLRAERIAHRELGYLVPQKVRTQPEMDNVVKKKNINKFKVGAKRAFNFFTRTKS